jgi:hypothetical protein
MYSSGPREVHSAYALYTVDFLHGITASEWLEGSSLLFAEVPIQMQKPSSSKPPLSFTAPTSASSSWKSASDVLDVTHFMLSTYCKHSRSAFKTSCARWLILNIPSPSSVAFYPEKVRVIRGCYKSPYSYVPDASYMSGAGLLLTKLLSPDSVPDEQEEVESAQNKFVQSSSYSVAGLSVIMFPPLVSASEDNENKFYRANSFFTDSVQHGGDVVFPPSAFPASYARHSDIPGEVLYTRLRSILQELIPFIETIRDDHLYRPAFLTQDLINQSSFKHRDGELVETYFNLLLWLARDISVPIEDVLICRGSGSVSASELIEIIETPGSGSSMSKPLVPLACVFYPYIPFLLEIVGLN